MSDESSSEGECKRPRLGILVRVAIYVPLLGFFGWQAFDKPSEDPKPPAEPASP